MSCLFSHLNSYAQFVWPVLLLCRFVNQPKLSGWVTSQVFTCSSPWGDKPPRASVSQPDGKRNKRLWKPNCAEPRITLRLQRGIYLIPVVGQLYQCRDLSWNVSILCAMSFHFLSNVALFSQFFWIVACFSVDAGHWISVQEMLLAAQGMFSVKTFAV